jgi:hypothetical protein
MTDAHVRRTAGVLLIVAPVLFTACFTLLQAQFEYPDILRQPTVAVLTKFAAGGPGLVAVWYAVTLSALLFVPVAVLVHGTLSAHQPPAFLPVATTFGVLAGLVQTLGFIRWPFLVPHLASTYLDPASSEATRAAVVVVFEAFHRYAGMAIGEHLGFLCTGVWTFLIAAALRKTGFIRLWLAVLGMVCAVGIALGVVEAVGWELAGPVNAISYLLWAVWLVVVGVQFLRRRREA